MRTQTKVAVGVAGVLTLVLVGLVGVLALGGDREPTRVAASSPGASPLVREDSRVIGQRGTSEVNVVEFLDFECEACAAAYPVVEELRERYDGKVTFVARYFPLPGHPNSTNAAHAVEAAARQDAFEPMYQQMYETQTEWSHQEQSQATVFRGYAEELGLDMAQYDVDVASADVAERVQRDVDDGMELGVQGTPTFYVDGTLVEPTTVQDFYDAVDAALAG